MVKEDKMQFEGVVVSANKDFFIVKVNNENGTTQDVNCTLSGKIRMNAVKILLNDTVKIEVDVYDTSRGRITYRIK